LFSEYGIAIGTLNINNVRGVWEFNMSDIAGRDIIDNDHITALFIELRSDKRTNKAVTAGYKDFQYSPPYIYL